MFHSVLLIIWTFNFRNTQGVSGEVILLQEPTDTYVHEGSPAYFNCIYNGTRGLPTWLINDVYYNIGKYPPRHLYDIGSKQLRVESTQLSDNGSMYQCLISTLSSHMAILYVYTITNASRDSLSVIITQECDDDENQTFNNTSSGTSSNHVRTEYFGDKDCCQTALRNYRIVTGIIGGFSVLLCGLVVILLIAIIIKKCKHSTRVTVQNSDHLYEQISSLKVASTASKEFQVLTANAAYDMMPDNGHIQANCNICYGNSKEPDELNKNVQPIPEFI